MWRRLSLLLFCCALTGHDALEADKSADPSREKMQLTGAGDPVKPDQGVPSGGLRGGERQSTEAPVVGVKGGVQQPTAGPLEDEVDNQENVISQVSVMCHMRTHGLIINVVQ